MLLPRERFPAPVFELVGNSVELVGNSVELVGNSVGGGSEQARLLSFLGDATLRNVEVFLVQLEAD